MQAEADVFLELLNFHIPSLLYFLNPIDNIFCLHMRLACSLHFLQVLHFLSSFAIKLMLTHKISLKIFPSHYSLFFERFKKIIK